MFFNEPLMTLANRTLRNCRKKKRYQEIIAETTPLLTRGDEKAHNGVSEIFEKEFTLKDCEELGVFIFITFLYSFSCVLKLDKLHFKITNTRIALFQRVNRVI